jgi:hypothetical protein
MTALVILTLLAATPDRSDAWMLWAHGIHPSGAEEWQQVERAGSQPECWAIISRLELAEADADVIRTVVEDHRTTAYYRDGTKYVVEFTCLPDSVDPRR